MGEWKNKISASTARIAEPAGRFALFVIYFWFGLLKVLNTSPASGLVNDLLSRTLPFIAPHLFMVLFGFFEMLIGILFLFRRADSVTIPLFFIHMLTTLMPLIILPQETWSGFFAPTLEGQYIIKNLALIAVALSVIRETRPIRPGK